MPCIIKNYRAATRKAAEETYKKIVDLNCTHKTSSASWDEMVRNRSVTCNAAASIALQKAGCLPVGVRVGHVSTKGKKEWQINTIEQAMYGSDRLKHCRLVWVDCKYKDLPAWLKKEGTVYIQWSNACVSAGKGWVWSCNQQGGYHEGHYTVYKNGVLANKDTYPFGGRIFVCIVPDEKWRQHYAVEAILGLHGNGEERKERFGQEYEAIQKMVTKMVRNKSYFLRWAADYTLEMYAGTGPYRKQFFGKYYAEVQSKVNWICVEARKCWTGEAPSGAARRLKYGKDYQFVQRQVDRTTK